MKKGRHRRYEEARAMKRSSFDDIESLMERIDDDPFDLPTTDEARDVVNDHIGSPDEESDEYDEESAD